MKHKLYSSSKLKSVTRNKKSRHKLAGVWLENIQETARRSNISDGAGVSLRSSLEYCEDELVSSQNNCFTTSSQELEDNFMQDMYTQELSAKLGFLHL
jgi:hypothetical protein